MGSRAGYTCLHTVRPSETVPNLWEAFGRRRARFLETKSWEAVRLAQPWRGIALPAKVQGMAPPAWPALAHECARVCMVRASTNAYEWAKVSMTTHSYSNFAEELFCEVWPTRERPSFLPLFGGRGAEEAPIRSRAGHAKFAESSTGELRNLGCVQRPPESVTSLYSEVSRESQVPGKRIQERTGDGQKRPIWAPLPRKKFNWS